MSAFSLLVLIFIAALLAGTSAVLWSYFKSDMTAVRARLAGNSETVQTAFGTVEYAESGQGRPVLVIHGSGGGFDQALEMAGQLASFGYRLVAPSRFGYLRSDFPDHASPELQADAFAALLDKLNLQRVMVLGGSAGALSAMQFAIRHPDCCQALVLLVPAAFAPDRKPNESAAEGPIATALVHLVLRSDFIFWLGITIIPGTMTKMLLATEPSVIEAAGAEEKTRARRILRHILPVSDRAEGLLLDTRTAGAPPRYDLERITCPVLAVSANDDLYGTAAAAAYTAAQVPNGRLVLYPTGGHLLAGNSEDVWREIASFLGRF